MVKDFDCRLLDTPEDNEEIVNNINMAFSLAQDSNGTIARDSRGQAGTAINTISPSQSAITINDISPGYDYILQGKSLNSLAHITKKIDNPTQLNLFTQEATITHKDFILTISEYSETNIQTTAMQLLDCLIIKFTKNKDPLISLPLNEYKRLRGLKDTKEIRKQVLRDMKALEKIKFNYNEKIKGKLQPSGDIKLHGGTGIIKNGIIFFRLNPDFIGILSRYSIMPYYADTLKLDPRYFPNAYYISRKIQEHKNMNYTKANADIISVKALIEACPNLREHEEKSKRFTEYLLTPFERDIEILETINAPRTPKEAIDRIENNIKQKDNFFTWHYCGKNEAEIDPPNNYNAFINAYIKITWKDYPKREIKKKKKHN